MLLIVMVLDKGHDIFVDNYPGLVFIHTFDELIISLCYFWIPVYLFLMQKRVYGQSIFVTSVKFITVALTYFSLMGMTIGVAIFWNLVTL